MPLATLNRHGLIAGATGTGKTKTLQLIAEQLSATGVPVVLADVKGDLSGLAQPGPPASGRRSARRRPATPAVQGARPQRHPGELLGLIYHYADGAGLPLLDLQDLRGDPVAAVGRGQAGAEEPRRPVVGHGRGVILRTLIALAELGGDVLFGEPEFAPSDVLRTTDDGRGVITAVEPAAVQDRPALFSTFLMWLLAELFEELP